MINTLKGIMTDISMGSKAQKQPIFANGASCAQKIPTRWCGKGMFALLLQCSQPMWKGSYEGSVNY
jgi:hypothetical protein